MKVDKSIIKELIEYLNEFNLSEIEITEKDKKIKVSKNNISMSNLQTSPSNLSNSTPNENVINKEKTKNGIEITSPIIGTAYHAPEPGAKKFVEVGKKITKGDTIMLVEAMKTMTHVHSSDDGIVQDICVEDSQHVALMQTIILLESIYV